MILGILSFETFFFSSSSDLFSAASSAGTLDDISVEATSSGRESGLSTVRSSFVASWLLSGLGARIIGMPGACGPDDNINCLLCGAGKGECKTMLDGWWVASRDTWVGDWALWFPVDSVWLAASGSTIFFSAVDKKFVEKSLYLLDLRNLLNATKQGVLLMLSQATFEGFLVHQMTYQKQIIVQ